MKLSTNTETFIFFFRKLQQTAKNKSYSFSTSWLISFNCSSSQWNWFVWNSISFKSGECFLLSFFMNIYFSKMFIKQNANWSNLDFAIAICHRQHLLSQRKMNRNLFIVNRRSSQFHHRKTFYFPISRILLIQYNFMLNMIRVKMA